MTSIGDTIVNDPQMTALATSLKDTRNQLTGITGGITQINAQITQLQNNVTQFTSDNTTLFSNLSARVTSLVNAGTSSADIIADSQCVSYSASIRDNQTAIAN